MRFPPVSPVRVTPRGAYHFDRSSYRPREDGKPVIHAGVDLAAPGGTPVVAPTFARVVEVETKRDVAPWRGYAPIVLLRDEEGLYHLLSHLRVDRHLPKVGDVVPGGGRVGTVDPKYRHVHWEVRPLAKPGQPGWPHGRRPWQVTIDPLEWLAEGDPGPFELPVL